MSEYQWTHFFQGIATCSQIKVLDLTCNSLDQMMQEANRWTSFLEGIALCKQITTLCLRDRLSILLEHDRPPIKKIHTIETLILCEGDINCLSEKQLKNLIALFPNVCSFVVRNNEGLPASSSNIRYLEYNSKNELCTQLFYQFEQIGIPPIFHASTYHNHECYVTNGVQTEPEKAKDSRLPLLKLPLDVCKEIISFLPMSEEIMRGIDVKNINNVKKTVAQLMSVFKQQRTPRNPLVSLFFTRTIPPTYTVDMRKLQDLLRIMKNSGYDISELCSKINNAFAMKKNLNREELIFKTFFDSEILCSSPAQSLTGPAEKPQKCRI